MPRYDYRCPNGHIHEITAPMDDKTKYTCGNCGQPMMKEFSPVPGIVKGFKGGQINKKGDEK